ncbi:hypothetical protein [Brevibacillus centrosporus]|jgi:hypothetical protein|uniref:Uncharacterized protein n=1 Tax=Brevibacillus centrosporus TaxID=54910 RepID=A0A1I3PHA0_9BACL|nr:hypothetical protein [Brevibacillus centrosporus]MEC2132964.1 hypothetical protein [Brevibacillus centrosporus]MED1949384.1 hypothetical protein [Brevibacillus centrosporus]MED4910871.1 hypothetical protein [Brevibacillus centrosporus]RNB73522.1 hypothetical protein EDM55_00620 [Brevibacillus centrosporus]SFJ20396.1 hypothetical protein SAMN05518846_102359 [Brevibacillus centrosporus]
MKNRIYRIGYEWVSKRELLERLSMNESALVEHKRLNPAPDDQDTEVPPEEERHTVLIRSQRRPGEWVTFNGLYEILEREPIPWIDSPLEYHQFGTELIPGNIRREKAPQGRIPARTKLQVAAVRQDTVFVTVPGHPSRRYEMSLSHARFAKDFPTELEMKLQVYAFPPRPDIFVDWLLKEGRKSGIITRPNQERVEKSAFQVWDDLRKEYGISVSAALLAIKQALIVLDRAGVETDFPYPVQERSDLSLFSESERDAFYSYQSVRCAMAAVAALLTTDPKEPLQDTLLMDIMLEQQMNRRRE